jgi:predicted DNA-binding transcriptional regulator AlpA
VRRLESRAAAASRARSEFDNYSDSILLTEPEAAAVTGFSPHTLKFWRLTGSTKGPHPTYLHGAVRYQAGEIRRWRAEVEAAIGATPMQLNATSENEQNATTLAIRTSAMRLDGLAQTARKCRSNVTRAVLADGPRPTCASRGKGGGGLVRRRCPRAVKSGQGDVT